MTYPYSPGRQPAAEIDARVGRWRRSLDPGTLWPESTSEARIAAYEQIRGATARILAGGQASLAGGIAPRTMGVAGFASGMGPLLGRWIELGRLQAEPAVAEVFAAHLGHGRRRFAALSARLREVVVALGTRDVRPVVLKGMHTGPAYFDDPGVRPSSDIDLLIDPAQEGVTADALRSIGLVEGAVHTRPERESWKPAGPLAIQSIEISHAENPWTIDVHHTLDRTYFAGLTCGLGFPGAEMLEQWQSDAGKVPVLRPPALTAFIALHAASDLPEVQLIRIVELIQILRTDLAAGRLSWKELDTLLGRTATRRLAYPAFQFAAALAPGAVDETFLAGLRRDATGRMRRAVEVSTAALPYHHGRRPLELRLAWAKGWRQVSLNLLDWIFPRGATVSARIRLTIWRHRLGLLLRGRMRWRADSRS